MPDTLEIQHFPLWDKLKAKRVPLAFDLEVTARCNLDCRHCYINLPAGDRAAQARELTAAEIGDLAGQAVKLGALWCLITGGEPLLRPDFPDLYLALKRRGLLVSVFTNATLITDEHARLFHAYPPRDVEVTTYGTTAETYERVTRRPGSFAAFRRGLDLLLEGGVRVRLKAMALRSNVHELPDIARFCRGLTKDYFRFDPLLHLRFDGDAARNEQIRAERLSPGEIVAIERADAERFGALQKRCAELVASGCEARTCGHLFHCGAGNGSFSVGHDGTFRLCSSLWHPETVFDLRRGTLREAWDEVVPRVREMRSQRPEFVEKCHPCALVNLCLWCPAHAHLETGRLDAWVAYFCEVAHERARAVEAEPSGGLVAAATTKMGTTQPPS
jgi:radical SAM protein with 4Fe4S-binding SPASM domain